MKLDRDSAPARVEVGILFHSDTGVSFPAHTQVSVNDIPRAALRAMARQIIAGVAWPQIQDYVLTTIAALTTPNVSIPDPGDISQVVTIS